MTLRPALAADVDSVRQLVRRAFLPYVARIGREPAPMTADYSLVVAQRRCWLVEDDGQLRGIVQTALRAGHLEVETLAVAPDAQGQGIGTRLLGLAEEQARAAALPEIRLCTNEAMTENLEYYPRRGFHEVGRATQHGYRRVFFARPVQLS
jgi:N-acetylglutamate synthase-like GNAT family acetyltransferase